MRPSRLIRQRGSSDAYELLTFREHMGEYRNLALPPAPKFWGSIEANLPHVARLQNNPIEQGQFSASLMCKLRMNANCSSYSCPVTGQRRRTLPC